jgi:DNA-binding response OmpR family regulator
MSGHGVLVIESDHELREDILIPGLQGHGIPHVEGVSSAREAYERMSVRQFALFVLDASLSDGSGLLIARRVRTTSNAGVVLLVDRQQDHPHQVLRMEGSMDACMAKPVDVELLAATLRSIFRHRFPGRETSGSTRDWQLDPEGWLLISPKGTQIRLTQGERVLLDLLFAQRSQAISRDVLIAKLLETTGVQTTVSEFDPHRLELLIHRLRRKIARTAPDPFPLLAVRGSGYTLAR